MKIGVDEKLQIEVKDNAFNDMETLDALVALDKGDVLAFTTLTSKIFADAEKKKVYDYLRNEEGRVPIEKFTEVIQIIMTKMGEKEKN